MTNQEISQQIAEIGQMLEILDANSFKVTAYQRAARMIGMISDELEDVYKKDGVKGLKKIRGIGQSISEKIEEYLKTDKIKYHDQLLRKVPKPIIEFAAIPGVGPKTAKKLFETLHARDINSLRNALKKGKAPNEFKEKTRAKILDGIKIQSHLSGRMLLDFAEPIAREITQTLERYSEVKQSNPVGSLRRMKETVGDIDLVAALQDRKSQAPNHKSQINHNNQNSNDQNSKKVIDRFCGESFAERVVNKGNTKATIIHKKNVHIDLEILPQENYGSLLQHFTGSKDHNIALRTYAEKHGFSISEHGIKKIQNSKFKNNKTKQQNVIARSYIAKQSQDPSTLRHGRIAQDDNIIKCPNEEKVYKTLGMDYIEPELRENRGEIEAALRQAQGKAGGLPKLVKLLDIKGDLQMHTNYSDGQNTIEEMAKKCKSLGYSYLAITDHPSTLGITQGLKEKDVDKYIKEIRRVSKMVGIHIFTGIEANIKPNGDIDVAESILKKLDLVLGAIHSSFRQDKNTTTKRLIRAIKNPYVQIIAHPTGRILNRRPGVEANWQEIFKACKKTNTALEINSIPDRLDLNDIMVREAVKMGVKILINTDSHQTIHLENMRYGVAQARRGWCEAKNIINSLDLKGFSQVLNIHKN